MDLRSQHQPVGVHQDVALASGQTLRSVVTTLGAAHPGGLYDLAVDHRSARVPVASLRLAHLFAQPVMRSSEPAVDPPPAEKNGSTPSARVSTLVGACATSSRSSEQVENGVRDPACRPLGRSTAPFDPAEQRFEDGPLFFVGEVGRVAWWGHMAASGRLGRLREYSHPTPTAARRYANMGLQNSLLGSVIGSSYTRFCKRPPATRDKRPSGVSLPKAALL
jgi:hypothetical protein